MRVGYLGHFMSKGGVSPNLVKNQDVEDWPLPQIAKLMKGFLCVIGYCRKFVKDCGTITRLLTNMHKKME